MSTEKWKETIVALATPPGIGAIAVIRLSGEHAIAIVNSLFPSKNIFDVPANTVHVGILEDNSIVLDEVVLTVFRAPRSYTGQDAVEISCHGSPYIQKQIIEACIRHGARLAEPGEFTMRAFLNGKMDLVQAEAVADLIASETKAAQETALNHLKGGFSHVLASLREELISFSALIELELDFSQEDVEFADRSKLRNLLSILDRTVVELIQSFQLGNVIKNGVSVAIVGKPNAGKSTLLNALLNENRAIVSEIPGTTRDTIEEVLNIQGILFRLIDTAGLRSSSDQIESIGVERSIEKMKAADLVVVLFDINDTTASEINELIDPIKDLHRPIVYVGNKAEKISEQQKQKYLIFNPIFISAKEKRNLDELKKRLYQEVVSGKISSENTIVTNARHVQSLQKVKLSLDDIAKGMQDNIPGDLIAIDIRECLYHLGVITGTISNEDQLDFIFSKFCIGK